MDTGSKALVSHLSAATTGYGGRIFVVICGVFETKKSCLSRLAPHLNSRGLAILDIYIVVLTALEVLDTSKMPNCEINPWPPAVCTRPLIPFMPTAVIPMHLLIGSWNYICMCAHRIHIALRWILDKH